MVNEAQVENGVKFLQHPQVRDAPLSHRIDFLEKKGLTPEEIGSVMSRIGYSSNSNAYINQSNSDESESIWKKLLIPGSLLGAGLGLIGLTLSREGSGLTRSHDTFSSESNETDLTIGPRDLLHKNRSAETLEKFPEIFEEFSKISNAMQDQNKLLAETIGTVKDLVQQRKVDEEAIIAAQVSAQTAELRAEIEQLRSMLLNKDNPNSSSNLNEISKSDIDSDAQANMDNKSLEDGESPSIEDKNEKLKEISAKEEIEMKLEDIRKIYAKIQENNDEETVKAGLPMIRMFMSNILLHPNVPRYRRLTTNNKNFLSLVGPIRDHVDLLEALGFKKGNSANQMEWKLDLTGAEVQQEYIDQFLKEALKILNGSRKSVSCKNSIDVPEENSEKLPDTAGNLKNGASQLDGISQNGEFPDASSNSEITNFKSEGNSKEISYEKETFVPETIEMGYIPEKISDTEFSPKENAETPIKFLENYAPEN